MYNYANYNFDEYLCRKACYVSVYCKEAIKNNMSNNIYDIFSTDKDVIDFFCSLDAYGQYIVFSSLSNNSAVWSSMQNIFGTH